MENKGLTVPVEEGVPRVIGETFGNLIPIAAATRAPQIAAGMNRMVDNAMAPATMNKQRGAIDPAMLGLKTNKDGAISLFHGTSPEGRIQSSNQK
jgi:hypothetical protein